MPRDEVIAKLKAVEPALRAHGAAALYLFGSYARNEAQPGSDVDVFIDKDRSRKFGFDEFMDIYFILRERLGVDVDYGTREGLHPSCGNRSSAMPFEYSNGTSLAPAMAA
jgi:predicted nucleotidyltransferase